MRLSEQFISFINFNIALFCIFIGFFLVFVYLSPTLYDSFFLYLKTSIKIIGIIFLSLGFLLFVGLRFQEGKKAIRMKTTFEPYYVDKKLLQQKAIHYFHTEKNLRNLIPVVKINHDQIIEINIQSDIALKKQDFDQFECDLKKIFAEIGYKKPLYFNYVQSI